MIKEYLKKLVRNYRWNKTHPNSQMYPVNRFDYNKVKIGAWSYGELNVVDFGGNGELIIGSFVSVAEKVTFVLNGEHNINTISTYPFMTKMLGITKEESFSKGNIVVRDDVWIGYGSTIISGVTIGQGAVVAAGAVVVKDVPPYAVVGGNPARILKYRFTENLRDKLEKIDYSEINKDFVSQHLELFYSSDFENYIDLLPRKQ